MIKHIIKRDGTLQEFSPTKVNGWGEWASTKLGNLVDWGSVVIDAVNMCKPTCSSLELQNALINVCLSRKTWEYNLMAGRLYSSLIDREVFNSKIPTVKEVHESLYNDGLMVKLSYSDAEYAEVQKIINHKFNLTYPHYQLNQIRFKYSLRNKVAKKEYESAQFVYMRMAMALAEVEPTNRLYHVQQFYEHFAHGRINVPTPYYVNLGTKLKGYASCSLYTTDDTAKSLATGDHIAYMMTCASAGIGTHIKTRSLGDPVRGGVIQHQGKLPYYRAMVGAIGANLQNGRGGASTVHYSAFDPEVEVIQKLRHPTTPQSKRIAGCHYSFGSNRTFGRLVAKNEEYAPFSYYDQPKLFEAQYLKDTTVFDKLYSEYAKTAKVKFNARDIAMGALTQSYDTGVQYLHFTDAMNKHTPFKEAVYQSNLCLVGDTRIDIKTAANDEMNISLQTFVEQWEFGVFDQTTQVKTFKSGNISWATVSAAAKTADVEELYEIEDEQGNVIKCTANHKIYTKNRGYVEAHELTGDDILLQLDENQPVAAVITVKKITVESTPVYDITVPETECFFANNLLVHNCQEIALPTKPFSSVEELYKAVYQEGDGEIGLCNLAGIVVSNITSDAQYGAVAYYCLKMVEYTLDHAEYPFPNLRNTAQARRSAGVGVIGLAHWMAKYNHKYDTLDGRNAIHELFETHMYHLINASLKLAKEVGPAEWMPKTLWPEGWLPIDTYEKTVDQLVTVGNVRDWGSLRKEIVATGGIRHSVLSAMMPGESSSLGSGTTNGVYPIRELYIMKTNDTQVNHWAAPEGTKLKNKYQSAWTISTSDMIKAYAVMQKWTDQGISADLYVNMRSNIKVSSTAILQDYFDMLKYGMKSRYYINSNTASGVSLNTTDDTAEEINNEHEICESCSL